jgi:X-X-X-Leu-X-X-Gly heptad repeat protein
MLTKLGNGAITIRNSIADTEAAPLLAEINYGPDALQDLLDLHDAAVAAVTARQLADGAQDAATKAFKLADKAGRKAFTRTRQAARAPFLRDSAALTALGLSGREPDKLADLFIATDKLLLAAQDPAYAPKLTARGVTPAKFADLKAKMDALKEADRLQEAAIAAAPKATAARDQAVDAFFAAFNEYKAAAAVQLADYPEIRQRLGL